MNYESYVSQFFNLDDYSDEKISKFLSKIYDDGNHWIVLEDDTEKELYFVCNKLTEIINEFRNIAEKNYISVCAHLDKFLEGDIPADTQIRLRNVQCILRNLKNKKYIDQIVKLCLKNIHGRAQNLSRCFSVTRV